MILTTSGAAAQTSVDISVFRTALEPYGTWTETVQFGTIWVPRDMPTGWRPYTLGHWIYTDFGWTWVSDRPWGWAAFHYGRWVFTPELGWVWVPDTVWGPAWVTWRSGDGFLGWAPLGPSFIAGRPATVSVFEFGIVERHWVFIRANSFLEPRINLVVLPPARNVTIINQTTNITHINVVDGRVINRGPEVSVVEQFTRSRVNKVRVEPVSWDPKKTPVNKLEGSTFKVVQPNFSRSALPKSPALPGKPMQSITKQPERKSPSTMRAQPKENYGIPVPNVQEQGSTLKNQPPNPEKRRLGEMPYNKPAPYSEKRRFEGIPYGQPAPYTLTQPPNGPKGPAQKAKPELKGDISNPSAIEPSKPGEELGKSGKAGVSPAPKSLGGPPLY